MKALKFTIQSFFILLGLRGSLSENDLESFQRTPGGYSSEKIKNKTGIVENPCEGDCLEGKIENGVQEPILENSALKKNPDN